MVARTAVTERDLQTMLRIVAQADEIDPATDSADPLPRLVLSELQRLIPCDNVSFVLFDAGRRETCFDQEVGDISPLAGGTWDELEWAFWRHYWNCAACSYPDSTGDLTSVTTRSDFYSDRQLLSFGSYCEPYRPPYMDRDIMLCLPSRPGRVLRLIFYRGPGMDFSPRDRGLLTLLRPHLHHAYRQQRQLQRPAARLTVRQRQLLELVAVGYTNGQIARRLSITEATVRKHLENIFQRLHVTSRTAAVTCIANDE